MQRGRLAWAAAMGTAAVVMLAGYTVAVGRQPPPAVPVVEIELRGAEEPQAALLVVVRDESADGGPLTVTGEDGAALAPAEPNVLGEYVLSLTPGQRYTAALAGGLSASFYLEENGAVTNVAGRGWSDGEQLHLDRRQRCTLRLLRSAGAEAVYVLEGPAGTEVRWLQTDEAAGQARAVFAGLEPGTYTLTGSDGTRRTVLLSPGQPDLTLGLE